MSTHFLNAPLPPNTKLSAALKRRKTLPAAAAVAALSLAGCGMFPQPAAAPLSPRRQEAERQVKQYQSDIELALDNVDRDRLRAAADRKAGATPAAGPSQAPVILASSTSNGTPSTPAPAARAATPGPVASAIVAANLKPAPGALASAGTPDTAAPAMPLNIDSATSGVVVMPRAGAPARIPPAEVAPFAPQAPGASALGAMTAMVTPARIADVEPSATGTSADAALDEALAVLRKNIAEHPSLNTVMALALLDGNKASEALKRLPAADQKVLSDLLGAIEAMKAGSAGVTVADRAAPLVEAAKRWQQDADLSLPRMVLATRVDSFGVFTPVSGTFEQGKRHTVIVYCEVANFASKKAEDGWYTTNLSQQETLITDDGLLVWRPNAEEVEDRSLNQRHDFYLVKKLTLPETLAAGKYTLRMSVTDRNTNKISMVSMPVEIVVK